MAAERHLLLGLLALQTGLIQPTHLVAAFHAWTADKSRSLADHLIALGHLGVPQRAVIEALADLHVEAHGGDVERSLAALPVGKSTRESLSDLGDPDIQATLGHAASGHVPTEDGDAGRTASYAVGTATADGQRFRVLRPHARGGLGAVFVALDQELHREVALKQILEKHADNPTSRARFLLEAEVTGGLEHPGIVPVYGLGTDSDGRPYYAMRFIRGDTLKEAVDRFHADEGLKNNAGRRSLELRRLLQRFVEVCNAIEYAHSRGVLHRDIKPANVIVGTHGETLVVDWGLAKATGRSAPEIDSGERTLVPSSSGGSSETLPGSALGTPAFMSPEQAEGDLERLGRRSDVYSVGATLYYILTGRPAAEGEIGDVLRAVQRGEFPPPRQHDPTIDRALEAVCLKAMAHKPADRYASARALADDVERWMADEPVSAWREPWTRTMVRWLTRHRTGVTAVGAAVLVALAGTGGVLAVQTRANAELTRANQEVRRANVDLRAANERERQRFDLALEAVKLFHGEVSEDLLLKEKPFAALRSKLLRGAADFYGKLERLLEGQSDPASRAALGRAYYELGDLTARIGKLGEAVAVHRKGLQVRRELASRPGAGEEPVLDVVRSLLALATEASSSGDAAGEMTSYEEARGLAEGLVASGRGSDAARVALADCLRNMAYRLSQRRPQDGLDAARRALAIVREVGGKAPPAADIVEELGECHFTIGAILTNMGRRAESVAAEEEAVAIYRSLAAARPDVYRFQNSLATLHNNMSSNLWSLGRRDDAIASQRQAVAIWRAAFDRNPAVSSLANNVAYGLNRLATYLIQADRPAEALDVLAQARPIAAQLVAADLGSHAHMGQVRRNDYCTGWALARMGLEREAEEWFEKSASIGQKLADENPSRIEIQRSQADVMRDIGWTLWSLGRPAGAASAFERERAIRQRVAATREETATDRNWWANAETNAAAALVALGRTAEARACCDRAIAIREDLVKARPEDAGFAQGLAESLMRSGRVRAVAGDLAGAAADWRRAAALYAGHPPSGESAIFRACCHGALAGLVGEVGSGITAAEASGQAEEAMAILSRTIAAGYKDIDLIRAEPGLDPLRSRDDFRRLISDLAFPADPFAYRLDEEYRPVPAPPAGTAPAR